jgi:D-alanyl-D-alanine carboxypeptidase
MPAQYVHGYAADQPGGPLRDVTRSNPDVAWAAGAMISTLEDLRLWAAALVSGSLLTPQLQAERLAMQTMSAAPLHIGYGLGIMEFGGLLGHNGGIFGYSSWLMRDPETDATIVLVTNLGDTHGGIASVIIFAEIAEMLFPDRGFAALLSALTATPTP